MSNVEKTLKERGSVHGDFTINSEIAQHLKEVVRNHDGRLSPIQKEAVDMILHKLARILAGDPNHKDHWHDIQGYARLAEDRI